MATLSSLASMDPDPSVSNRSNASRISCLCSSVSSTGWDFVVVVLLFPFLVLVDYVNVTG